MINSINHSYYFNYSRANKYNKSEDKLKDKEEDTETRKDNNTIIPRHRTIRDIKDIKKNDNNNRIRVTQIEQKENMENKENKNLENIKRNESKIKRKIK